MPASDNPQTSMYEREVEDVDLLAALDDRERANTEAREANKAKAEAQGRVEERIAKYELGEGSVLRVGRWIITKKTTPAADVSFTRGGGSRLQISLLDE